jgi:hypothetical protein
MESARFRRNLRHTSCLLKFSSAITDLTELYFIHICPNGHFPAVVNQLSELSEFQSFPCFDAKM